MTIWRTALERPSVLVTICTVRGSAPRETGARMLVWAEGQHDTIGGGALEHTVIEQARRLLETDAPWRFQNYPLGPLLGQCCGGHVGLLLERLEPGASWLQDAAAHESAGRAHAITSSLQAHGIIKTVRPVVDGPAMGESVSVSHGTQTVTGRIGEGAVITQTIAARPHLLMFGAGHVGQALAPILQSLPFTMQWYDTRADFIRPGVTLVSDAGACVAAAPPDSHFLIFTQSHALDYELVRAVLARGDFVTCGLIGSATKRARFERRLVADGIAPHMLKRLTCPIGSIGLSSKLPSVMAVGIAAELLLALEARSQTLPVRVAHA